MNNYYITFGSDPQYPYGRDEYVLVKADDEEQARLLFKAVHPNRPGSNLLNFADIYSEKEWEDSLEKGYWKRSDCAEVISVLTIRDKELINDFLNGGRYGSQDGRSGQNRDYKQRSDAEDY